MCCFSRPVRLVSATRIFARPLGGARQFLAYGMTVDIPEDLAMVLPVPVPPGSADDAVRFVDLSSCPSFLADLSDMFPTEYVYPKGGFGFQQEPSRSAPKLVVHDVGDFEASFVPSQNDFGRLDERFRLPPGVFDELPRYADWGFCVFKLKPKRSSGFFGLFEKLGGKQTIHPMAFELPLRDPTKLFFPTVHVHDGKVHETALFDHDLFAQLGPERESVEGWIRSAEPASDLPPGAHAWVAPTEHVFKQGLHGSLANEDIYLPL